MSTALLERGVAALGPLTDDAVLVGCATLVRRRLAPQHAGSQPWKKDGTKWKIFHLSSTLS